MVMSPPEVSSRSIVFPDTLVSVYVPVVSVKYALLIAVTMPELAVSVFPEAEIVPLAPLPAVTVFPYREPAE